VVRRVRVGDRSELNQLKRLLAVESDLAALKTFADAHSQEDEISIPIYERFLETDQALGSLERTSELYSLFSVRCGRMSGGISAGRTVCQST
jgi:hypothetical protein